MLVRVLTTSASWVSIVFCPWRSCCSSVTTFWISAIIALAVTPGEPAGFGAAAVAGPVAGVAPVVVGGPEGPIVVGGPEGPLELQPSPHPCPS